MLTCLVNVVHVRTNLVSDARIIHKNVHSVGVVLLDESGQVAPTCSIGDIELVELDGETLLGELLHSGETQLLVSRRQVDVPIGSRLEVTSEQFHDTIANSLVRARNLKRPQREGYIIYL